MSVAMDLAPYAQAKWQGTGQGCRPLGRQKARLGSQVRRNHGGRGSPGAPGPKGKIVNSQVRREQADLTVSKQGGARGQCCNGVAWSRGSRVLPPGPWGPGLSCVSPEPGRPSTPCLQAASCDRKWVPCGHPQTAPGTQPPPRQAGGGSGAARGSLSRHCDHP